jgi:hypothetical protein
MEIEQDYHWQVTISRVLNPTEAALLSYVNSEREAIALAKVITLPKNADYYMIEQAVIAALASAMESVNGVAQVEYLGGRLTNRWKEEQ